MIAQHKLLTHKSTKRELEMKYKVFYTIPEQSIIIEADNEYEAEEKAQYAIDGVTIEKSFRANEVNIVGIENE